jgi:DNA-binding transcriptional ArsR family regulator
MRLELVELLGEGGEATATALARRLPITRQGVSKHIAVLQQAGLVESEARGRSVLYRLRPEAMTEAAAWLDRAEATWDARLARLRAHLEGGAAGAGGKVGGDGAGGDAR